MVRLIAWVVFAVLVVALAKGCTAWANPWSVKSPAVLLVPGCGDKPECVL